MNWWLIIARRGSLFALAGLLLGSAVPPPSQAISAPRLRYADIECTTVQARPCTPHPLTTLVTAPPPQPAKPAPKPAAAPESDSPKWAELGQVAPSSPDSPALTGDAGRVRVLISLSQQKAWVFRDGELFGTSPVSTGKRGKETPTGTFPILQKRVRHFSNLYDNAPMPYMQRLTHSGIALHAGQLPGYPASHGCIRFPWSFAKKLYGITDFSTRVTITRDAPESAEEALGLA